MNFSGLFNQYGWELLIIVIILVFGIPVFGALLSFVAFQIQQLLPIPIEKVKGKHILIIGASQGLGKGLALALAGMEASIVTLSARGTDKDEEGLSRLDHAVNECRENCDKDVRIESLKMDVTDYESVNQAINELIERVGKIDWVIISSGMARFELLTQNLTPEPKNERTMFNLNYFGPVNVVRSVLLQGKLRGDAYLPSRIITVGSAAAASSCAGTSAYAASKAALKSFTDNMRNEESFYKGVKFHHFMPANIDSPGLEAENLTKPDVTRAIEGTIETISAEYAAYALIRGILRDDYFITSDFISFIARSLSNSLNPRQLTLFEIISAPLYFFFGDLVTRYFVYVAKSEAKKSQVI